MEDEMFLHAVRVVLVRLGTHPNLNLQDSICLKNLGIRYCIKFGIRPYSDIPLNDSDSYQDGILKEEVFNQLEKVDLLEMSRVLSLI